jgi:hypothetical protein
MTRKEENELWHLFAATALASRSGTHSAQHAAKFAVEAADAMVEECRKRELEHEQST